MPHLNSLNTTPASCHTQCWHTQGSRVSSQVPAPTDNTIPSVPSTLPRLAAPETPHFRAAQHRSHDALAGCALEALASGPAGRRLRTWRIKRQTHARMCACVRMHVCMHAHASVMLHWYAQTSAHMPRSREQVAWQVLARAHHHEWWRLDHRHVKRACACCQVSATKQ